jgi:hypothetical protein
VKTSIPLTFIGISALTLAGWHIVARAPATDVAAAKLARAAPQKRDRVDAARFAADGALARPANMDKWVFLGASLGMGYSQAAFDPGSPGNFQVVQIEPAAYAAFVKTGEFPDGTMLSLNFYSAEQKRSINRAGFVMGEPELIEIHVKDSKRFPPHGFNFFTFEPEAQVAQPLDLPNACVACHVRDGAYDGVFTQFYPVIRDLAEKAANKAHRPPPA